MKKKQPEAGCIYYTGVGFKERKRLLVVSNDDLNRDPQWRKAICVYVTSKHVPGGPWVSLPSHGKNSVANCTELFTLDKRRLDKQVGGSVKASEMREVYRGIALALGAEETYRDLYR